MCGRFAQFIPLDEIIDEFDIKEAPDEMELNFNIAPGQVVGTIVENGDRRLMLFQWGLVTDWSYKTNRYSLINIRSETLLNKKTFKRQYQNKRCLIIASGFYEWQKKAGKKVPYYIYSLDQKPFGMAGIWNSWNNDENEILSCAIITTDANRLVQPIHNRMPVIIPRDKWEIWLNTKEYSTDDTNILLEPYPADLMKFHRVSFSVNNTRFNNPECIQSVIDKENTLF